MIYIQSNIEKTRPHHFDASCAMWGAIESGFDYKLVSYEEVESGKWDNLIKTNLFVGSVEFMRMVFSRVGLEDVRLPRNSNREFQIMELGEVRRRSKNGERWFIKPIEIKLFTGFILDEMVNTSIQNIPDSCKVRVYKPLDEILSEWRVYVVYNNLMKKNPSLDPKFGKELEQHLDKIYAIVNNPKFDWEGNETKQVRSKSISYFDGIFLYQVQSINVFDPITLVPVTEYIYEFCTPNIKRHLRISKINGILEE